MVATRSAKAENRLETSYMVSETCTHDHLGPSDLLFAGVFEQSDVREETLVCHSSRADDPQRAINLPK